MSRVVSIAEAKDQLSEWVRSAEYGHPVLITRRGKPVAAIVGSRDLERLQQLKAAGPQAGLAGLAGGWAGSHELVASVESIVRGAARPIPDPE